MLSYWRILIYYKLNRRKHLIKESSNLILKIECLTVWAFLFLNKNSAASVSFIRGNVCQSLQCELMLQLQPQAIT